MSSEALAWAFKQDCKSASVKFTLVALCECANYKTGRIMPSIDHLTEITGQNRKTIIANVAELEASGFIRDTGERVGRTMQIKVYEAVIGTVPKAEQSQKRNSTVSRPKQSQKRDTEPSWEPSCSTEPKGSSEHSERARPRKIPMTMDWEPTDLSGDVGEMLAVWPPGKLKTELADFREYWTEDGSKRPGWDRTFRSRIRTVHPRIMREARQNDRAKPSNDQSPRNPYVRAVIRNQAARSADERGQPDSWAERSEAAF